MPLRNILEDEDELGLPNEIVGTLPSPASSPVPIAAVQDPDPVTTGSHASSDLDRILSTFNSGGPNKAALAMAGFADAISAGRGRSPTNFMGNIIAADQQKRRDAVSNYLQAKQLKREEEKDARERKRSDREDKEYEKKEREAAPLDDPKSRVSIISQSMAKRYAPKSDFSGISARQLAPIIDELRQGKKIDVDEFATRARLASVSAAREATAASKKQRIDESRQKEVDKYANKVSKAVTDSGLADIETSLSEIETILSQLPKDKAGKPKDIPGYGRAASLIPTMFRGGTAEKLRQAVQSMSNIKLKQRSGAAVTAPEFARFNQEFGTGRLMSENSLLNGIARLRKSIDADKQNIIRGVPKEALDEYESRAEGPSVLAPSGSNLAELSDDELMSQLLGGE